MDIAGNYTELFNYVSRSNAMAKFLYNHSRLKYISRKIRQPETERNTNFVTIFNA